MAMESPALADSLVAWASGHLSASDDRYAITALEARSASLSALSKSISTASDITYHETNTATCLILLTSEVCLGNYAGWYNHLTGAKHIIQSACNVAGNQVVHGPDAFKHSAEGQWVLRNFAYHDVLGSVTLGTKPLIHADYLEGITDVVDSYIGVASQLLVFISEISNIDTSSELQMQEYFAIIETNLQSWHCHVDSSADLAAVAYTYRSAALIYLYRQMRKYLRLNKETLPNNQTKLIELDSKIQTEVFNTLIHISNVSPSGIPDSALLFPLFVAGGEAREGCHIDMIQLLLRLMLEKRPFHNIIRALGVLEVIWNRRMQASEDEVDWEDVVTSQGGGLLLT
ncbi:hypothetical protein MW887_000843 [Aspergillus wentii]|nr:hypothetical protein MW887_000843 [Aspergillus wentii]